MPTTLNSFIASEFRMGFREKFVTEGLNQKMAVAMPPGVYRGFRLGTTATVNAVAINADLESLDSVALFETSTGFSLTVTRAGNFEVDLSSFVDVGNPVEVVIALLGTYVVGNVTTAVIKGYELDPIDDFTGDPDVDELIVLGTVTIPTNSASAIPSANITSDKRVMAWRNTAPEATSWQPVIKNSHFEYGRDEDGGGFPQFASIFWESSNNTVPWIRANFGDAPSGNFTAGLLLDTGPYTETLTQRVGAQILEGQRMLIEFQKKVLLDATGGTGQLNIYFKDSIGVELATESVAFDIDAIDASFVKVVSVLEAPADAAVLDRVEFDMDSVTYTSGKGTGITLGSAQLWIETPAEDPAVSVERVGEPLDASSLVIRGEDATSDYETVAARISFDGDTSGTAPQGKIQFKNTNSLHAPALSIPATINFQLLFESVPASGSGYRKYTMADGGMFETVNAGFDGNWFPDDITAKSYRIDTTIYGQQVYKEVAPITPATFFADSAWNVIRTIDPIGSDSRPFVYYREDFWGVTYPSDFSAFTVVSTSFGSVAMGGHHLKMSATAVVGGRAEAVEGDGLFPINAFPGFTCKWSMDGTTDRKDWWGWTGTSNMGNPKAAVTYDTAVGTNLLLRYEDSGGTDFDDDLGFSPAADTWYYMTFVILGQSPGEYLFRIGTTLEWQASDTIVHGTALQGDGDFRTNSGVAWDFHIGIRTSATVAIENRTQWIELFATQDYDESLG